MSETHVETVSSEQVGEMPAGVAAMPATASDGTDGSGSDESKFTLEDVTKRYFAPDQLADANEVLAKIVAIATVGQIKRNFEPDAPFPDGYGLAIVPLSKRHPDGKTGNVTIGVAVAAIPDPETVGQHEKGSEFIRSAITDVFMAKVANACRPRADGTTAPSIPYEITDFLESRRGRETLKAFSEIAPLFVKALRKKGITFMTAQILRQTLQSKQFAEVQFEKIPQDAWQKVLDGMIVKSKAEGHDPQILINWKDTRDSTEVADIGELTAEDFDDLV